MEIFSSDDILQPQETREEEIPLETVQEQARELVAESTRHAKTIGSKQEQERLSQQSYASLWTFVTDQRTLSGVCGDQNPVVYMYVILETYFHPQSYSVKIAKFNEELFRALLTKFDQLHNFNTGPVFLSLFDQTLAELQLTHTIQALLRKLKRDPVFCRQVLDHLFIMSSNLNTFILFFLTVKRSYATSTIECQYYGTTTKTYISLWRSFAAFCALGRFSTDNSRRSESRNTPRHQYSCLFRD